MATPPLHPDLALLGGLVGDWAGQGRGDYPTIDAFTYGERTSFWHVGKPFLFYMQKTWSLENEEPLHSEMGYFRPAGANGIEVEVGVRVVDLNSMVPSTIDPSDISTTPNGWVATSSIPFAPAGRK